VLDQLAARAATLGALLEPNQIQMFGRFCVDLAEYNAHTNLVSNSDPLVLLRDHILDSLTLVPLLRGHQFSRPTSADDGCSLSLVDVGSGAGFPGFVLAIACPELSVTLVESIGKKAKFLEMVAGSLGLHNRVTVINDRAESLGRDASLRETFLAGTARAVGPVDVAAELTLPLIRVGGFLLLQKSHAQLDDELTRARLSLSALGAGDPRVVVPDAEALGKQHVILVIEKTTTPSSQFPRSPAAIKRHPLGGAR